MLDMEEILNTIEDLENANTTFDNCLKLASLYIVRDNFERANKAANFNELEVVQELNDILPQYRHYCDTKRRYQLKEVTQQAVEYDLQEVCREIQEFIHTLYSSTDFPEERHIIEGTLQKLTSEIV